MSGFIGLLSLAGFFTLVSYRLLPALIISFFLFAVCVVWQIVWFDSRHFSRVVAFAISQIRPWTLLLISLVSSIATALSYAGFLAVLYSLKRIWDTAVPGCTKDRNLYTSRFIAAIILLSATTYWFTHVISSFAHILGAIVAKNRVILNVQKESGQSSIQRKQIRAMLRSTYNSVCYGAGLVSYTVFLKDLVIGLGQNISLGPTSPFLSTTGALLLTVLTFIGPFHGALDRTNSPWTFSMMALDSTKYWHASKAGAALMSAAGLNILKETGLFQMIEYFPVLIGVVSAVSTFLLVTLIPGPIVEYNDILVAEVLVAFAYFGGSQISRAAFAPFNGAMCTIFVMMAREPAIFQEHYGVVWTRLEEFNPSVAEALLKWRNGDLIVEVGGGQWYAGWGWLVVVSCGWLVWWWRFDYQGWKGTFICWVEMNNYNCLVRETSVVSCLRLRWTLAWRGRWTEINTGVWWWAITMNENTPSCSRYF